MITSDSRYADAAHENALTHLYDALGTPETVTVTDQAIPLAGSTTTLPLVGDTLTEISRDTTYLLTTVPGSTLPRSYMAKMTDNMQLLAYQSLQDPTRWWVIADANPQLRYPFDLTTGDVIHLPG
jgi:hypothetical protein